jgi:hypothetical protein
MVDDALQHVRAANSDDTSATCNLLRQRAAEYRRLSKLAADATIAQELTVIADAHIALANKLLEDTL